MSVSDLVNRGLILRMPAGASASDQIARTIIVSGIGRSGTTMVAAVLAGLGILSAADAYPATLEDKEFLHLFRADNSKGIVSVIERRNRDSDVWGFKLPSIHAFYTPEYHEALKHSRNKPIRFLEVGTGGYDAPQAGGSSLRMWADYFPYASIIGVDVNPKRFVFNPRVKLEQGSQEDPDFLEHLVGRHGPFDVIVDDGSHLPSHILASIHMLYPGMTSSGIYIVEDLQVTLRPGTGSDNMGSGSIFELGHRIALAMHALEGHGAESQEVGAYGSMTRRITVIRNAMIFNRGTNTYPSNFGLKLDSGEVQEVYGIIEQEAEANPAPRNALSLIDMNIWGGRPEKAAELAVAAADRYPHDADLLAELERMMSWAGRNTEELYIRAKRIQIS